MLPAIEICEDSHFHEGAAYRMVNELFDFDFLEQQLRWGVLDIKGLVGFVTSILKQHCAREWLFDSVL
jgi:hypothetical protein